MLLQYMTLGGPHGVVLAAGALPYIRAVACPPSAAECLRLLCDALQAIRRESNSRALVLLDEVGTGTDPGEGAALGVALLHALIKGGFGGASFTMATTHHR